MFNLPVDFPLFDKKRVFSALGAASSKQMLPENALVSSFFPCIDQKKLSVGEDILLLKFWANGELFRDRQVFRKEVSL